MEPIRESPRYLSPGSLGHVPKTFSKRPFLRPVGNIGLGFQFFNEDISELFSALLPGWDILGEDVPGIRLYWERNKKCREKSGRERGCVLRVGQWDHTWTLESEDPVLMLCFLILLQLSGEDSKWALSYMSILVSSDYLECCVKKGFEAQ